MDFAVAPAPAGAWGRRRPLRFGPDPAEVDCSPYREQQQNDE
jgi:hypothetical protein